VNHPHTVVLSSGASVVVSESQFTLLGADLKCVAHQLETAQSANEVLMEWSQHILNAPVLVDATNDLPEFSWISAPLEGDHSPVASVIVGGLDPHMVAQVFNALEGSLQFCARHHSSGKR
jgi:hypothetical protein